MKTYVLKNLLIKNGTKQHVCEVCFNTEWNNKKIPIELHHINGDNKDNRIENLKIICPNCHAQTDNYKSKNKSVSKHCSGIKEEELINIINKSYNISEVLRNLIGNKRSEFLRNFCKKIVSDGKATFLIKPPSKRKPRLSRRKPRQIKYCLDCGCEIDSKPMRCKNCSDLQQRRSERPPSLKDLTDAIVENGYVKLGKIYGVSDSTIRSWVRGDGANPQLINYKNYNRRN